MIKSVVSGFVLGTVFFAIAPLGLGIGLIEFFRPILIPGVALLQLFRQNATGSMALLLGFLLNGVIYSLLFLSFSVVEKQAMSRKAKQLATLLVVLAFLGTTGMLGNLYLFLTSADKSWILQIGA